MKFPNDGSRALGIQEVAAYIPEITLDNLVQAAHFGMDPEFVLEKIGASQLTRLGDGDDAVTMACQHAFALLAQKTPVNIRCIECIIVCTQNPDRSGLPHNSALLHGMLDAPEECACFDIGLGCSGYVYSIQVATSFMHMHGMKKGLLFTCDPYSRILDETDKNTSLLFGDAATVTLISDTPAFVCDTVTFATRGKSADSLTKQSNKLLMNGRAIFNFALTDVPKQISKTLASANLGLEQIDLFLLHQGSKFMLENVVKRIGDIQKKCPISINLTGNTVSSSLPILLEKFIHDQSVQKLLLSGFGVGLSWATAIYHRNNQ
jgi:3-oxoacyl-[acyl-carrier-protein] synthase III